MASLVLPQPEKRALGRDTARWKVKPRGRAMDSTRIAAE